MGAWLPQVTTGIKGRQTRAHELQSIVPEVHTLSGLHWCRGNASHCSAAAARYKIGQERRLLHAPLTAFGSACGLGCAPGAAGARPANAPPQLCDPRAHAQAALGPAVCWLAAA